MRKINFLELFKKTNYICGEAMPEDFFILNANFCLRELSQIAELDGELMEVNIKKGTIFFEGLPETFQAEQNLKVDYDPKNNEAKIDLPDNFMQIVSAWKQWTGIKIPLKRASIKEIGFDNYAGGGYGYAIYEDRGGNRNAGSYYVLNQNKLIIRSVYTLDTNNYYFAWTKKLTLLDETIPLNQQELEISDVFSDLISSYIAKEYFKNWGDQSKIREFQVLYTTRLNEFKQENIDSRHKRQKMILKYNNT